MSVEQNTDRELLPDGRVVKGATKIESIVTRYEERVQFTPVSATCGRMFRRDFNYLTAKMFLLKRRADKSAKAAWLLAELEHEVNYLVESTVRLPAPVAQEYAPIEFRLISPQARQLFDVMVTFDKAMAKVTEKDGLEAAEQHCADFFKYYGRLKDCLFGRRDPRDNDTRNEGQTEK
ncbi:hypothetical protein [Pseudoduganella sp. R-34]|jgi:hypothetical protein|uniref:hypothetical protein n=1 Tax=Pseudoduganella sp. R-34 TaxID=3404062 RepID=UPI003CF8392B